MPTIEAFSDALLPLLPSDLCSVALARFDARGGALLLAVVEDGQPVGVIERLHFLRRLAGAPARDDLLNQPVSAIMEPEPVVIEGSTSLEGLADILIGQSPQDMLRGFVVVDQGRYQGVSSPIALLRAEHDLRTADSASTSELDAVRREAAEAVEAAAQARSEFLSLLSRELRTPLNGVAAVADLLRRQPIGQDAQAYVQTIMDSSATTLRILEDAVDLARSEVGELTLDPRPVLLRQLMDDLDSLWGPRAVQDGVSLMIGYEGDTELAVNVDAPRLRQVFNHLIGNALKFARHGVVEAFLSARSLNGEILVSARVRDNGPGIAVERIPGLFEIAGAHDGSKVGGLGLPICHHVLRSMGGTIRAESNPGQGVTFVFELTAPRGVIEADTTGTDAVSLQGHRAQAGQPHILIVDDNATNRVVAQALCEMFGCTSEQAVDGVEALEAIQTGHYDLVLMDIKMPRMDGVAATQAIRALDGPVRDTPIIALTANADPEDAKRYVSIGMASVVEKPIKPERLVQAINAVLTDADDAAVPAPQQRVA